MDKQFTFLPNWLVRGTADFFPELGSNSEEDKDIRLRLSDKANNKKPLRIKLGIDPTGSEIHLGHTIVFRKLRAFQDQGHTAVLIIGDFTARIGDPTGKSKTRIQLTEKEVEENAKTYLEQLGKGKSKDFSLLDFETQGRLEIRRNSEWLEDFDMTRIIELLSKSTVGQMLAKEEFAKRYSSGTSIALHEFLYPLFQGFDSVAVQADVELGGVDQKFNVAMGRDMQRHFGQKPQFGLLVPILVGLDGVQKMSKSLGNTVSLFDDPLSMYSKLEKVPDIKVQEYLNLLTDCDLQNLPTDPRDLQKFMALSVTAQFHGISLATAAQENASKILAGVKDKIQDISELSIAGITFPVKAFYLISALGLSSSSSEARRQIQGGAVRLDGKKILDPNFEFGYPDEIVGKIIQLGKKVFRRISC